MEKRYLKKLVLYVKKNLKKGFTLSQIKTKLDQSKVDPQIIDEVFLQINKKSNKKPIYYLFFSLFLLGILILFNFFQSSGLKEKENFVIDSISYIYLEDYSDCLEKEFSYERIECYYYKNINVHSKCGILFHEYINERSDNEKKLKEGEIIIAIDNIKTNNLSIQDFSSYIKNQTLGKFAFIQTNIDNYTLPYIQNEINETTLLFSVSFAFCKE